MLKRHLAFGLAMGLSLSACDKKEEDKDKNEDSGFMSATEALTPPTKVNEIAAESLESELRGSSFLGDFGGSSYKSFASCMEFLTEVSIVSDAKNMKIVGEKTFESCDLGIGATLKNAVMNIFASATCNGESNWAELNGKKFSEMETAGNPKCTVGGTDYFTYRMKGTVSFEGMEMPMVSTNGRMTKDGKPCTMTVEGDTTKVADGCVEFDKTSHEGAEAPGSFESAEFESVVQNSDDDVVSGTIKYTFNNWTGKLIIHSREKVEYELSNGTDTKSGTLDFSATSGGDDLGDETGDETGTEMRWSRNLKAAL